jgi:mRNA interferase MazF
MPNPGDVVTVDFPGATGVKRRPAVVVSSDPYHAARRDVTLGVLTTRLSNATNATDHLLLDWVASGLHAPSAFRSYFGMALRSHVNVIGHLSDRDWQAVKQCVHMSFA